MSEEQDEWLEKPGNLERWTTGPKQGGLKAWKKRVLVTQRAGRAWEKLCCGTETSAPYNFEGSARSLGMLMTIDGSGDDKIRVQRLTEPYTFADVDGGSEGAESEVEEEPGEHDDVEAEADGKTRMTSTTTRRRRARRRREARTRRTRRTTRTRTGLAHTRPRNRRRAPRTRPARRSRRTRSRATRSAAGCSLLMSAPSRSTRAGTWARSSSLAFRRRGKRSARRPTS
eukprot:5505671-Prymnesium_polylepis.3